MTEVDLDKLKSQLIAEEGRESVVYKDEFGNLTGGIGHELTSEDNYSFGDAIPDSQIESWYQKDIAIVQTGLSEYLSWVFNLDEVRLRVFYDLCFNMGIKELLKFVNTLALARTGNWESAAEGLEYSLWYSQVGSRGPKLVAMLRTGQDQ